ncbi:MAG: peptide chain release factor 1 [Alphaproteobacteria bacterium]|nr:peptide chain release factor 1 [Alphaproteobacteria bacterium]
MNFSEKLTTLMTRYEELTALLSTATDGSDFVKFSKELAGLEDIVSVGKEWFSLQKEMNDAKKMKEDASLDAELRKMAEDDFYALKEKNEALEEKMMFFLLPKDEADEKNAILEVRAGTGGDEAALFAYDLFRMYEHYAAVKGWSFEVVSTNEIGIGGYKEAVAKISGTNVFSRLKFETGVHRVQRVPATESSGRVHTSAATVAVLPEAEEVDVQINDKDLRIDTYRSSGAGGQHVNKTDSAIRITHLPTGLVVECQDERSQFKNKDRAMSILRSRLYDKERQEKDKERSDARRSQVGSGDRSERIRTYNFPQGRVTDHRINLTLYKIEDVMNGSALDEVVEALIHQDQMDKLLAFNNG